MSRTILFQEEKVKLKFLGIIPARYASTRFPGKPLALLGGKPVIQHVYERASQALEAVVATDDARIFDAVKAFGGNVVMTSPDHPSGTDRCREAYANFGREADVVVNIQGDEPFVDPSQIESLKGCFDSPDVDIATLIRPFDPARGYEALANPNSPKVVVADNGDALYFSRSVIPYLRGHDKEEWPSLHRYFTHVGIYAFRTSVLEKVVALPRSPLEIAESLEQLRWLQGGFRIRTAVTDIPTVGIDTPDDLRAAEKILEAAPIVEPDRTTPPPTADCAPATIARPVEELLPNGIMLHTVNGGDQQVAKLVLFAEGGSAECGSQAALQTALATIYDATADYDAETLADIVDFNGGRISVRSDSHFTGIGIVSLSSKLGELLPVLGSVVTRPSFNPQAVEVARRNLASSTATQQAKVETRTYDRLRELMLGEGHPAGTIVLPDDFEGITSDDCVAATRQLTQGISHAFLGGSLSVDDIAAVREFLLTLPGKKATAPTVVPMKPAAPTREHIEMPGTVQWAVAMGIPAIGRDHPDYNALRLAVVALGGYFGSRLMKNIREEKGLTYGISASLNGTYEGGYVQISARCDGANVERLIDETRREMAALAENPPKGDELRRLRLHVWSNLTSAADSSIGTIDHYITNLMVGAPDGYFARQLDEIVALTPERISEIATKYLDPSRLTVITAGDDQLGVRH